VTATAGPVSGHVTASMSTPATLVARPRAAAAVVVGGCVLLEGRGLLVALLPDPTLVLVALFAGLAAVSLMWPIADDPGPPRTWTRSAVVAALGVAAFGLGRLIGGGHAPVAATATMVAANSLAAVAEEAFFRRLCFALLLPAGATWAVVGSAVLFAAVHLSTYGAWVLPLDLAAGLVFGWQRLASGTWRVSAVTHVIVNLLVVL
jgi:Type II CAAX prenyl endopeptidase Rce1-like